MRRVKEDSTRVAVGVYAVLVATPFVFAATHTWFWNGDRPAAPASAALVGVVLAALFFRHRWAWWTLVVFNGFVVISYAWEWTNAANFAVSAVSLAVLLSPSMRRYVADDTIEGNTDRDSG
jgi:hypothetical protein